MHQKNPLIKLFPIFIIFFIQLMSFSTPFDIDLKFKTPELQIIGSKAYDYAGYSLASADINNDGYADIVIGAEGADAFGVINAGVVYIIYGSNSIEGVIDLANYSGTMTKIYGPKESALLGYSLCVGDVNDDYYNDIIIGAKGADEVYIIYGSSDLSLIKTINLQSTTYPYTKIISNLIGSQFGFSLACGDVNNDMYDDVIVGAPLTGAEYTNIGETYIIYGNLSLPDVIQLSSTTVPITVISGPSYYSKSGFAVACGKMNADYYDDVLIGAPFADTYNGSKTGQVFIVNGSSAMPDYIDLAKSGYNSRFTGADPGDNFGYSLATGFVTGFNPYFWEEDILFGAPGIDSTNSEFYGMVYLFFGGSLPTDMDMRYFTSYQGVMITAAEDFDKKLGQTLAVGNINADMYEDILIGDRNASPFYRSQAGAVHLVFGRSSFPSNLGLGYRSNTERAIFGEHTQDYLGDAVAWGDINSDGLDEAICGATGFDKNISLRVGKTYVISFDPPQITRAIFCDNINPNNIPDPNELIILQFNQIIQMGGATPPTTILPQDFYLTGSASLGTSSAMMRNPNNPTQVIIILGQSAQGITIPGNATGIDIGAGIREGLIYNPFTSIDAQDGGIPDENDTAIDIKFTFTPRTIFINALIGGTVNLIQSNDNAYSKHKLYIPPNALSQNMNFSITNPSYPSNDVGLPTGVRFIASNPKPQGIQNETLNFLKPATLTVEYNPDMVNTQYGYMEKYVRIFELKEPTPGLYQWILVPGYQSVNFYNSTVSVQINSLSEWQVGTEHCSVPTNGTGGTYGTLPVVLVDENSVSIKTGGSSPNPPKLTFVEASGPTLQPGITGAYTLHIIEFPGYVQCEPSDPLGITVKIRQATLLERVGFQSGYTYFPNQSGAVFTVETKDYSGSFVAFSSPINMTVQYLVDPSPDRTDVIDFNNVRGEENQMRICKSTTANPPNYSFVGGTQTVDRITHKVSINNLSDLTDADGVCMYGAVVDKNIQPSFVANNWELFE